MNRALEAKTRALAGWKGYTTNLIGQPPEFVIDAYHQLWRIEKSFRMSNHDLQARPIYHHTRESIEAHLTIVFAALAVSHWIEHRTGWSIKKFVRTTGRYRNVQIRAGQQKITPPSHYPTTSEPRQYHQPRCALVLPTHPAAWPGDRFDVIWSFTLQPAASPAEYVFSQIPQQLHRRS